MALTPKTLQIDEGSTAVITARVVPAGTPVVWSTGDAAIATVDGGTVTGIAGGETVITAAIEVDGQTYTDTCTVTVEGAAYSIELNESEITIALGETFQLIATTVPEGASVTWYIEDMPDIASVSNDGLVTASATEVGTCTVTAELLDSVGVAYCTVNVVEPTPSITLNEHDLTMQVGETFQFTATTYPSDATVRWQWEDETNYVTVDQNGLATAVDVGTYGSVYADILNGEASDTCNVTVVPFEKNLTGEDFWNEPDNWFKQDYQDDVRKTYLFYEEDTLELVTNMTGNDSTLYADISPLATSIATDPSKTYYLRVFCDNQSANEMQMTVLGSSANVYKAASGGTYTLPVNGSDVFYVPLAYTNAGASRLLSVQVKAINAVENATAHFQLILTESMD